MKSSRWLVPLLLAAGCATSAPPTETDPPGPPEWPVLEAGTLRAGAAGGFLSLPVGLPLGGYTARSRLFGGFAAPDQPAFWSC